MEGANALGSRYELEVRLGVGAMGEVWRALDRRTGAPVAAKVLRAEYARDTDIVTRFIQERSILMGLTHPNIVRVHDLVVEGERLAIVMDLVEGGDLRKHLRERGPIPSAYAVPLACVVLDALASAHESGCLHRDVKPDNVLLAHGEVTAPADVRLSDFSIARLAHDSTVQSTGLLGTPGYMPPELFRDGQFSAASDVYATGILLYELLGGRTPFAGAGTAHTIGHRHVSSAPPPLPVSPVLWAAIERMLDKDPRARLKAAATAAMLRELPRSELSLEPLPPQPVPDFWQSAEQTTVRRDPLHRQDRVQDPTGSDAGLTNVSGTGPSGRSATKPDGVTAAPQHRAHPERATGPGGHARERRRRLVGVGTLAAVVLLGAGGVAYAATRGGEQAPDPASGGGTRTFVAGSVSAQRTDDALPTGLTVARMATYSPDSDNVRLTITYTAQSTPLRGPFLEVLPAGTAGGDCPLAAWDGAQPQQSVTTTSGIRTDCPAYVVEVPPLEAQGRSQVEVVVSGLGLDLAEDPSALQGWLDAVSASTSDALAATSVRDDQFPVQRVTGIWVRASPFSVRQDDEIQIQIGPQLVSGSEGPPFFDSFEVGGLASGFLQQIAGGYSAVRLDACPEVKVNRQRQAIALRPRDGCEITAEVGNALTGSDQVTIERAGS